MRPNAEEDVVDNNVLGMVGGVEGWTAVGNCRTLL